MTIVNSSKTQPTSQIQKEYVEWFESEKAKGLKDIKFFIGGNLLTTTVDSFILETKAMDEAIKAGRHSPLPDDI